MDQLDKKADMMSLEVAVPVMVPGIEKGEEKNQEKENLPLGTRIRTLESQDEGTITAYAPRNEMGTDIDYVVCWDEPLQGIHEVSEVHPDAFEVTEESPIKKASGMRGTETISMDWEEGFMKTAENTFKFGDIVRVAMGLDSMGLAKKSTGVWLEENDTKPGDSTMAIYFSEVQKPGQSIIEVSPTVLENLHMTADHQLFATAKDAFKKYKEAELASENIVDKAIETVLEGEPDKDIFKEKVI